MVRKLLDGAQNFDTYVDDVLGDTGDWNRHMSILRDFLKGSAMQICVYGRANAKLGLTR